MNTLASALLKSKVVVAPSAPELPEVFHSVKQHPTMKGMAIVTIRKGAEMVDRKMWRPEANRLIVEMKATEAKRFADYRASVKAWESFYKTRYNPNAKGEAFHAPKPKFGRLA